MPWIEATLRGQKVLARAKSDGSLDVSGGRVEIRYRPGDAKAYRASASNLSIAPGTRLLGDDACAPGDDHAQTAARRSSAKKSPKSLAATAHLANMISSPHATAEWIVYTDGACSGNPGPAGSGMVVIAPGGKIHEGYAFLGTATNNVAEITGVLLSVEAVPQTAESIAIHTDSKYAIGVLSLGWKAKVNGELIQRTRAVLATRTVRFVHVPGHAGVPMNERADELAREAIRRGASQPLPKLEHLSSGAPTR
jgi:ribonuclease HI